MMDSDKPGLIQEQTETNIFVMKKVNNNFANTEATNVELISSTLVGPKSFDA